VAGRALIVELAQVRSLFSEAEDTIVKALTYPLTDCMSRSSKAASSSPRAGV
jgi:hypothetical protein